MESFLHWDGHHWVCTSSLKLTLKYLTSPQHRTLQQNFSIKSYNKANWIFYVLLGEFVLTKPKIQVKQARRQYSANESYSASWDPRVTAFVQSKKNLERPISQRWLLYWFSFTWIKIDVHIMNCRYIGTFIADFHRTLIYGGIFLYPNNATTPGKVMLTTMWMPPCCLAVLWLWGRYEFSWMSFSRNW